MNLPAMARITRIPLERLQALSAHSPVFSPGVDNYYRMGHLRAIWSDDYARRLAEALRALAVLEPAQRRIDQRMQLGQERGGRGLAAEVAQQVRAHA